MLIQNNSAELVHTFRGILKNIASSVHFGFFVQTQTELLLNSRQDEDFQQLSLCVDV